jgi:hypothetical protein
VATWSALIFNVVTGFVDCAEPGDANATIRIVRKQKIPVRGWVGLRKGLAVFTVEILCRACGKVQFYPGENGIRKLVKTTAQFGEVHLSGTRGLGPAKLTGGNRGNGEQ